MTSRDATHFNVLCMLGLITPDQLGLALTHPQRSRLPADAGLAEHLVWMVEHRILQHAELVARGTLGMVMHPDDPVELQRYAILSEALPQLDELMAHGLIAETQRQCAARLPQATAFGTHGEALAYLVENGVLLEDGIAALRAQQRIRPDAAGAPERLRILEHAAGIIQNAKRCDEKAAKTAPASVWRRAACALLFGCGLVAGYQVYGLMNAATVMPP